MEKRGESDISKIAIIGTEGAGKTVFVTVWSKLLEKQEQEKPFIIPDPSTFAYIEKNWSKLRNGQWPESTPQSEFVHLFWRLKMPNGRLCQINVCDVAGHDIRRLFTGNKPQASDDPTKAIYDTVAEANIVLVIINLKDFITTTETQRIDNCANLLSMLQFMFEQKKKVALVLSQWHEYESWVSSHGSVEVVLSKYMAAIYNTCCLEGGIKYFKVAAVIETTLRIKGDTTFINPNPHFTSSGFAELNDWLTVAVTNKTSVTSVSLGASERKNYNTTSSTGSWKNIFYGPGVALAILMFIYYVLGAAGCVPKDEWKYVGPSGYERRKKDNNSNKTLDTPREQNKANNLSAYPWNQYKK